jgi:putative transposase
MDFVSDSLVNGVKFRTLTIVDNFSRVSPAVEVDSSLTGKRVAEVLDRLGRVYGLPKSIRVDNGTGFCSKAMDEWAYRKGIKLEFIRPWETDGEREHRGLQREAKRRVLEPELV